MLIGLTFDLRDYYRRLGYNEEDIAEFDSEETISAIEHALSLMGHSTVRIGNIWELTRNIADSQKWDLIFNVAEGLHGLAREAQVPALLEAWQIPYTFSPPEVIVTCHDKSLAKLLVHQAGVKTARWQVVRNDSDIEQINLPFPLFVKPLAEGTGKGISAASVVKSREELKLPVSQLLKRFSQPVLVETYLSGREFTVGITGTAGDASLVGVMEIISGKDAEVGGHTYQNKENCETLMEYHLADCPIGKAAGELALAAWRALGCRDAGRIDIRCDENGVPHFLEVNPLAGLHPTHSDLPILASMANIDYQQLLTRIMDCCLNRLQLTQSGKNSG
ncbi:MAG: D-alanine--D-alanine ligase [bacterium]|nr:D-alanine--D-alanine ligase [bacterium]